MEMIHENNPFDRIPPDKPDLGLPRTVTRRTLATTTGREVELVDTVLAGRAIEDEGPVLAGYCDPAFKRGEELATPEVEVIVYEMTKNLTISQFFESCGRTLPGSKFFTRSQVTVICRDHRDLLREGGNATFLPLEDCVVRLRVYGDGRIDVHVREFSYKYVWNAEGQHRVILPLYLLPQDPKAERLAQITAMSSRERRDLAVSLLEHSLARAQNLNGVNSYTLIHELEYCLKDFMTCAGWAGKDGQGM